VKALGVFGVEGTGTAFLRMVLVGCGGGFVVVVFCGSERRGALLHADNETLRFTTTARHSLRRRSRRDSTILKTIIELVMLLVVVVVSRFATKAKQTLTAGSHSCFFKVEPNTT